MASPNKDLKKELATPDSSSGLKRSSSDSENKDPLNDNSTTENNTVKKRRRIVKIVCRKSAPGSGVIDLCETDSTSGSGVIDLCATDSSDSSQTSRLTRKDTDSPFLLNILQKNTSEWTNIVLPIKFNLKFLNHVTVDCVFTKSIFHFIENEHCSEVLKFYLKGREIDKEKYECFQHAFLRVFDIDSCHISHISDDKVLELNQIFEECQWIDTYVAQSVHKQQLLKRICDRELCKSLKSFMWQLLYMHRKCKRSTQKELTEGMYLELFVSFARIFGLNIVSGSNVDKYSLSIDNKDFFVIPDAVICHSSSNDDDKIFAVIKVKSCSQDEDKEEDKYLGSTCNHAKHIGSSLKGQHCGQFLCTLSNSAFGSRGMYGFIVQGTNVTLTSFIPDDGYFEHLCSGNLCEKGAVMTYSKQYNILRKEDRKQLVETFLDFEKLMKFVCMKK